MKWLTYRGTPGLDRYPEAERFAVWREAHQHLMRADYSYAMQHQAYLAKIAKVSVLVPLASLPLVLGIGGAMLAHFFHWPVAYGAGGIVVGIVFALGAVVHVFRLAFRQQDYMNQHVAAVLRQRETA